ncbi:MAG: hypothetical protein M5R42_03815 [Rhodocyclaceae bacterium]|nr:hypothetical protein [Rhodocyclaceae bacterium]
MSATSASRATARPPHRLEDWRNQDLGFGTVGLAYSTTNAHDSCTGNAATTARDVYCY